MSTGPALTHVENPFIDQLVSMMWKFTTGNLDHRSATGRESFRQVLQVDDLVMGGVRFAAAQGPTQ
jgi:hypothetical protein